MFRVAIQVKELISSNVTSAIEAASNPAKMLNQLRREIEEAIIALEGERTKTRQHKKRLEASLTQNEMREADWSDKAKAAMDHDREDLARQALMAREDCRETIGQLKDDIAKAESDLAEIEEAIAELEAKREDTREQARAQAAADSSACRSTGGKASKAESHLNRISTLEKRAEFATEDSAAARTNASVDREIDEMRRASSIDAEIEKLKGGSKKAPTKRAPRKKAK
ncbi:PspA/IM30 family protein [Erythrobacter sp. THAF29]|uniref:PspA/IM30 family protein n=1 Tax=Erythrobacter sp. THAF29 TaxID=2587851 RepID=UPI0012690F4A|nr:PspA/IM30 family protein [Erythrobacter sp. THAF29]QFT76788.1 Phage shock protein A [Erythrobacter sp. THAF29]